MHLSSLPSDHGIGTMGKEAYKFVDFLAAAKQTYWQMLPIGPTSYGDSPYQSYSTHAGNPYFIDLDMLIEEGLLTKSDVEDIDWGGDAERTDYEKLYNNRFAVLKTAYNSFKKQDRRSFDLFLEQNEMWISNYALFMAIKDEYNGKPWLEWDEGLKRRDSHALWMFKDSHHDEVEFWEFVQYKFFEQWKKLKEYANNKGIQIIGDIPIYVALDSAAVWVYPDLYDLDADLNPRTVAGCPPDAFSATGHLWGNPLYDWKYMKTTGYKWWLERVEGASKYFDVIRIDHFRGFEDYWAVPYSEKTAKNGRWVKGPSVDFITVLRDWFSNVQFIAEDLGIISEEVVKLLQVSGFPGMRVLEFGMADDGSSFHAPHNHTENCVCYISTHDNVPIMGWLNKAKKKDLKYAKLYYGLNEEEGYNYGFIRGGMSSVASLFVAQIQDYLGLGEESTMNVPGTLNNWRWRLRKGQINGSLAKKIAGITHAYKRGRTA